MPIFSAGDFDRKVDQIDLVSGVRSESISRSVHASLCMQRLRFLPLWLTSRHTQTDDV